MMDVLIAVEDPGAANFVLELPDAFARKGLSCRIIACGHAREFLAGRSIAFEAFPAGGNAALVFEANRARLLLAGTSQNLDSPVLALIDEFKRRQRPAVGFVDMAADADLRFRGLSETPLHHAPSCLLVSDRMTEAAFVKLGYPAGRIRVCGHPAYDRVRQRALRMTGEDRATVRMRLLGTDPAPRPVWMFAAEHGEDDPRLKRGPGYTLHGRMGSDRRVDIVLEEVLDARSATTPRPFLVLRLHPKNDREEFARYLPEVDYVSQGGDPLELVWSSDLVLGLSSMLLMEAALTGRPTLSIVPQDSERAWSPSVAEGLTQCVTNRDDLGKALRGNFEVPRAAVEADAVSRVTQAIVRELPVPACTQAQPRSQSPARRPKAGPA